MRLVQGRSLRLFTASVFLLVPALWGDALPKIEGESVAGKTVALPDAAAGHPSILVLGFSHASQVQVKPWSERLDREFPDQAAVTVYPIAVLEAVPRLVRGMASHGIKSGTPKEQRERFLLVYHKEAEIKQAAAFSAPDDAYLVLVDGTGMIRWRYHGAVSDEAVQQVREQVKSLQ